MPKPILKGAKVVVRPQSFRDGCVVVAVVDMVTKHFYWLISADGKSSTSPLREDKPLVK